MSKCEWNEVRVTNNLLLIIDLQNGFMNDSTDDVIDNIIVARKTLKISKCVFSKL